MSSEIFWTVNKGKSSLFGTNGIDIHFTKYEFNLFYYLITNVGEVKCTDSIIKEVWGESENVNFYPDSSNLIQLISKTRRQLKLLDPIVEIKSRRGVGYYLTLADGYDFHDDKIFYSAQSIFDRDPDSEKKFRLLRALFRKEIFCINENRKFKIRDLVFVFFLSVFFVGLMLGRKFNSYPELALQTQSPQIITENCDVEVNIIFSGGNVTCDDISKFQFVKNIRYIVSEIGGVIYVTSY